MLFRRKERDIDPKEKAVWGDLMGLGMVFPIAILLGFFIGRWAGRATGFPRAGVAVGLIWGMAAGFWELFKTTLRLNKGDESSESQDPGKDDDDKRDA